MIDSPLVIDNALALGLEMISKTISDATEIAMVRRWRREYDAVQERTRNRKKVLWAIGEGYDTVSEISFATGINITTLRRVIARLVESKKIKQMRVRNLNSKTELKFELI